MKNKTKSPEEATVKEAFKYVTNKKWSYDEFNEYVLKTYKTGYDYGVQDIKDNYILKAR